MKLLILTLDTTGEVQPLVALPRGLAAPHRFEGFVRDQAYRSPGSTPLVRRRPRAGAGTDILVPNGQVVVDQHVAEKLGIPAALALPIPM